MQMCNFLQIISIYIFFLLNIACKEQVAIYLLAGDVVAVVSHK